MDEKLQLRILSDTGGGGGGQKSGLPAVTTGQDEVPPQGKIPLLFYMMLCPVLLLLLWTVVVVVDGVRPHGSLLFSFNFKEAEVEAAFSQQFQWCLISFRKAAPVAELLPRCRVVGQAL